MVLPNVYSNSLAKTISPPRVFSQGQETLINPGCKGPKRPGPTTCLLSQASCARPRPKTLGGAPSIGAYTQDRFFMCWPSAQGPGTMMEPGRKAPKRPGLKEKYPRVLGQSLESAGRAPYVGVYTLGTHGSGSRPVAAIPPTV